MMIVHEIMGRDCGWLTAATAKTYRDRLDKRMLLPQIGLTKERLDVHAIYIPELTIDLEKEAMRLKEILDRNDNVNIFISEGAGVKDIVARMEAEGKEVQRDAFGHVKLDSINPGKYFADTFSGLIGAEKVLVQSRATLRAPPPPTSRTSSSSARRPSSPSPPPLSAPRVCRDGRRPGRRAALHRVPRIKGGKPFKTDVPWFQDMLRDIGQTRPTPTPSPPWTSSERSPGARRSPPRAPSARATLFGTDTSRWRPTPSLPFNTSRGASEGVWDSTAGTGDRVAADRAS